VSLNLEKVQPFGLNLIRAEPLQGNMLRLFPLLSSDLHDVRALQPEGWGDIMPHIEFYIQSPFCYPIKVVVDNKLIGIGTTIIHTDTAWLAHIIVSVENRNQGIGKLITESLLQSALTQGCTTVFLIATALGAPVYSKSGFQTEGEYVFLKELNVPSGFEKDTRSYSNHHKKEILEFDRRVSGEDRSKILQSHLKNAHIVLSQNRIEGYYLPSLGEGLIIADNFDAGIALLQRRIVVEQRVVLPAENKPAIAYLLQHGAKEFLRGTRMWYGQKKSWNPSKIYSRIGGNLG
jgi:N-acetylglutamate synthase-like GNAT family acetyltransferase